MNPRTLKIEEDGDPWAGKIKPKIRLKGKWLERAGFRPGQQVQVTSMAIGVIELRSGDTVQKRQANPFSSEESKRSP